MSITMNNFTSISLGELLSSENETIKRNAVSILKVLQKKTITDMDIQTGEKIEVCPSCGQEYDIFGRCKCCNKDAF